MKTFLSQTEVRLTWAIKQGLLDPYRFHQWIWKALPDDPAVRRDFLFRSDAKEGTLKILLLSARVPRSDSNATWKTTEVSDTFLGHEMYRFQLRANPTCRNKKFDAERDNGGKRKHRRFPVLGRVNIHEWFVRKFADAGCEVRYLETTSPRKIQFHKGGKNYIYSVDASGVLVVHDDTAFRSTFNAGIGPAKGFGFGLLLLQPIQL